MSKYCMNLILRETKSSNLSEAYTRGKCNKIPTNILMYQNSNKQTQYTRSFGGHQSNCFLALQVSRLVCGKFY